ERVEGRPGPGDEVEVYSYEGRFVARGLFNPNSAIRVRLYRWDGGPLDDAFWSATVAAALRLREGVLRLGGPSAGYRVLSGGGDGRSGLPVGRYARWLVAQFRSLALFTRQEALTRTLLEQTGAEGVLVRTERLTAEQEGLPAGYESVSGALPVAPVEI